MSKKSKKSFSNDMGETLQKGLFEERPASMKSFAADLEVMFKEALGESVGDNPEQDYSVNLASDLSERMKTKNANRRTKPDFGLDLLIRSTLEEGTALTLEKKRITFSFDNNKLEKLKTIAEKEKARLKDIIDQLIDQYIAAREQ